MIADDFTGLTKQLEALGLTVWSGPAATSFDDVYEQIEQLGAVTGHVGEAAELVAEDADRHRRSRQAAPQPATPLTYYHELDNTYYSVTENTFIGQVYSLFGLQNIADFAGGRQRLPAADRRGHHLADPDFIFLADGRLRRVARDGRGPARLGGRCRPSPTATSWWSMPTSRRAGDRASSTTSRPSRHAVSQGGGRGLT